MRKLNPDQAKHDLDPKNISRFQAGVCSTISEKLSDISINNTNEFLFRLLCLQSFHLVPEEFRSIAIVMRKSDHEDFRLKCSSETFKCCVDKLISLGLKVVLMDAVIEEYELPLAVDYIDARNHHILGSCHINPSIFTKFG